VTSRREIVPSGLCFDSTGCGSGYWQVLFRKASTKDPQRNLAWLEPRKAGPAILRDSPRIRNPWKKKTCKIHSNSDVLKMILPVDWVQNSSNIPIFRWPKTLRLPACWSWNCVSCRLTFLVSCLVRIILYHSFPNLGKSTNHLVGFIWIVHTPLLRLDNSPSILWAS
jgi:hypothetical protein